MVSDELTVTTRHLDATVDDVYAVLSDGWLLPLWVVGATHMRDVDAPWPAEGARAHHQVGAWPFTLSDSTRVVENGWPRRLVLQARAWPLGEARIELSAEPGDGGVTVRMAEAPTHGIGRWLDNPLARWLLAARNRESLNRLAALVENRATVTVQR